MIRRILLMIAIVCMAALFMTACGRQEPAATSQPPVAVEQPASEPLKAETPSPATPAKDETPAASTEPVTIKLATTTSTENSGLLGWLLPAFENKTGIKIHVIAVGTGKAIKHGENGDVDVILVHARKAEEKFVADGFGVERIDVMYNDFVIVGPPSDPAGIKGSKSAKDSLTKIAAAEVPFISRGDDSGTHKMEKELWAAAGITPVGTWYIPAGQGMGAVLIMADEKQGYTLSDRATFVAYEGDKVNLQIVCEGDEQLFNPYSVIAVNPNTHPHTHIKEAQIFIDFLTSPEGQTMIGDFKVKGRQLFVPSAKR